MSRVVLAKLLVLATLMLLALPLWAQERITAYDIQVQVNADGSLEVTERIGVRAEGGQIRRGIYRDFPTRYRDRLGNRVVAGLEVIEVLRDGRSEPWFTEQHANGVRINTGNDDLLPVPADIAYTLRYRTTRQLGFFEGFEELYWNAIGHGWIFPIERGSVEVRLPAPVPAQDLRFEAYTGAQGERGRAYRAQAIAPGTVRWTLAEPLAPQEGLTVVLGFPKGLVDAPSRQQRLAWLLKDNLGVLVALAGLVLLIGFCVLRWRRLGRDPRPGVVIARYEAPTGYSPGALRFMQRMGYDTRCFSADLLSLAVAGSVHIHRDKGLLGDTWELQRTGVQRHDLLPEQRVLLDKLLADGQRLELKNTNASSISGAQSAHGKALEKRFNPDMFKRNGGSIALAVALFVLTAVLSLVFSAGAGGGGIALVLMTLGAMVLVLVAFGVLVKAPTAQGRALLDQIEGLKLYLGVAEREELRRLPGPDAPPTLDAERYEALLPYAVALDVEDAWTRKFTLAAGAAAVAAASARMGWYHGAPISDLGSFTKAMGSHLGSQIASSSQAPGSSSGGGGGGFSGGGGGGGGGGGR
jgi:uncharacterized membrane protein YgcG